jgi:hypothetical protein
MADGDPIRIGTNANFASTPFSETQLQGGVDSHPFVPRNMFSARNVGSGNGIYGEANQAGTGVRGISMLGTGVEGTSNSSFGMRGIGTAVGVEGNGRSGVSGWTSGFAAGIADAGVIGASDGVNANGVIGEANNGPFAFGVWGKSTSGFAGTFEGAVQVLGTLTKSGGGFQIDCPGKETDCYLRHSFVESSDMKNVYDGIERLGEDGSAWIELPEWFKELNRDCRYQLTAIGEPAPDLHIAEELSENRFRIAGGTVGMKVSWQVTGIRKDPWAERNRIVVEEDKPEEARGTYLHPEAFGQPETRGEGYTREEALRSRLARNERGTASSG